MQKIILICFVINSAAGGLIRKRALNLDLPDAFCLVRPSPFPLETVKPTFNVYTRSNSVYFPLSHTDDSAELAQQLDEVGIFAQNRQVVFIVHGYLNNANTTWLSPMKDEILKADDSTVIIVDWRNGADVPKYATAASNTQTTAAAIASFAQAVANLDRFASDPTQLYLYCIGHSLGAQVCGQAGRNAKSTAGQQLFNRVTGLDPAGPGFAKCNDHLHIDKDSAICVDIIHTDGDLKGHALLVHFGTSLQCGHIDFYPNGGHDQPGCLEIKNDVGFCTHEKAHDFFMTTINRPDSCAASGLCSDVATLPNSCASNVTQKMGYYSSCHAKSAGVIEGAFYLTATAAEPFC